MDGKIQSTGGVIIPTEVVEKSNEIKQQHRSLRQTQVYRDISNLKYLIVKIMGDTPRRYAKYIDEVVMTVSNAKQSIALGMRVSNLEVRRDNLDFASAMIEDLQDDAVILHKLDIIDKRRKKEIKKLAQKVAVQTVRLRDYFKSQGIAGDVNS